MSRAPSETAPRARGQTTNSYERIVRAAYKCFERFGVERTSIEDIAREAGVTRPTVYRYFRSKVDIVDLISAEESRKVSIEVRKRLIRGRPFEDLVSDAVLLIARIAIENPYVRRILAYRELEAVAESRTSEMHKLQRDLWGPMLEHAAERGELAGDLGIDEVLVWMTLTQRMLLTRLESGPMEDGDLRRLIRRFIVEPLLARAGDQPEKAAAGAVPP
jgi:AcrR family transcriptional regulator